MVSEAGQFAACLVNDSMRAASREKRLHPHWLPGGGGKAKPQCEVREKMPDSRPSRRWTLTNGCVPTSRLEMRDVNCQTVQSAMAEFADASSSRVAAALLDVRQKFANGPLLQSISLRRLLGGRQGAEAVAATMFAVGGLLRMQNGARTEPLQDAIDQKRNRGPVCVVGSEMLVVMRAVI